MTTKENPVSPSQTEPAPLLNLFQRIIAVRRQVSYVQKNATIDNKYKAVTHDAVVAVLRDAMNEHGIIAFPSMISSIANEPAINADGTRAKQFRYEGQYRITFINADNPEDRETMIVDGHAMDNADKGPGKAISYAFKYGLLKMFLLETGEDEESRYSEAMDDAELGKLLEAMSSAATQADLDAATSDALTAAQEAGDRQAEKFIIRSKAAREAILPIPISKEDFDKGMLTWTRAITTGKKTADEIITALASKRWAPSKEQEATIRAIKYEEQQQ